MPQITDLRQHVQDLLASEFAEFTVRAGKLHGAQGRNGPIAGASPLTEAPRPQRANDAAQRVLVQVYGRYETDPVDPDIVVNPITAEAWAHRFQQAVAGNWRSAGSVWFLKVAEVAYPDDPMGNKTRFEAVIEGWSENPAVQLVETGA